MSDADRIASHVMEDVEKGLELLQKKLRQARWEMERKGVDRKIDESIQTGKEVSKKVLKEVGSELNDLAKEIKKNVDKL